MFPKLFYELFPSIKRNISHSSDKVVYARVWMHRLFESQKHQINTITSSNAQRTSITVSASVYCIVWPNSERENKTRQSWSCECVPKHVTYRFEYNNNSKSNNYKPQTTIIKYTATITNVSKYPIECQYRIHRIYNRQASIDKTFSGGSMIEWVLTILFA